MGAIGAMHYLSHRIAASGIVPAGTTFRHLVCPIFVFRGFLSNHLDQVTVSTFWFAFPHLAAPDTELKYLLAIGVATLVFIVFLTDILNRPKEGGSKINMTRIANRLHQSAALEIFRAYKIMLTTFST
jgi:hypothetical protein